MLENLDKVASGYKTYTASTAFLAISMYLASRGIDTAQYTSAVEQLWAIGGQMLEQASTYYAAIVMVLRKARG